MQGTTSVTADVGGKTLTIECGLLAQQAAGATTVRIGDTVLFSAVTCTSAPREGIDYESLSDEEKAQWESLDWGDEVDEKGLPTQVNAAAILAMISSTRFSSAGSGWVIREYAAPSMTLKTSESLK